MKAYNTPNDELHIESNAGEKLVKITSDKAEIKNLDMSSMGITSTAEEIDAATSFVQSFPTPTPATSSKFVKVNSSGDGFEIGDGGSSLPFVVANFSYNPDKGAYELDMTFNEIQACRDNGIPVFVNNGDVLLPLANSPYGSFTFSLLRIKSIDTTNHTLTFGLLMVTIDSSNVVTFSDNDGGLTDNVISYSVQ